jgi:hypothetical protein
MFNATYFRYNGRWSGEYGLRIADFGHTNIVESDAISTKVSLLKAPGSVRFFYSGVEYDSAPTCEFCVLSDMEITAEIRTSVLSWLIGKNGFKPLTFEDGDNSNFTYYCIFTSAKNIWVNGRCYGFRLTAQFDSPYARGTSTTVNVGSGTNTVTLCNRSDIVGNYVYPIVQFTGASVDIVNETDDENRHFTFSGLANNETITVDNEMRFIRSTLGGEKLSKFTSKKWLRLRPGNNTLRITSPGSVTITCPYYAMIGY